MSNPKSVIAWMAALSVGLSSNVEPSAVTAATLVCIVGGFVTNALYSIVFSVKGMMLGYQHFRRKIDGLIAMLFAVAGFGLIRSGIND